MTPDELQIDSLKKQQIYLQAQADYTLAQNALQQALLPGKITALQAKIDAANK